MEAKLEHKIVLVTETYTGPYPWALREQADGDDRDRRDKVPWLQSVYFTATELTVIDGGVITEKDSGEYLGPGTEREIQATLRPGFTDENPRLRPTLRMFGTDRKIKDILFYLRPCEEESSEQCIGRGFPAYYDRNGSWRDSQDDHLSFVLHIHVDKFDRIASSVLAEKFASCTLRLEGVHGFYVNWSHVMDANEIKVLTDESRHSVECIDETGIKPRRLGKVEEADLTFKKVVKLEDQPLEEENDWTPDAESEAAVETPTDQQAFLAQSEGIRLLKQLRLVGISIVVLLALALLFL